jgi:hypothetical protein
MTTRTAGWVDSTVRNGNSGLSRSIDDMSAPSFLALGVLMPIPKTPPKFGTL